MCGSSPFNGRCLFAKISGGGWLIVPPSRTSLTRCREFNYQGCLRRRHSLPYFSSSRDLHSYNLSNRRTLVSTANPRTDHGSPTTSLAALQEFAVNAPKPSEDNNSTVALLNDETHTHRWKWERRRVSFNTFAPTPQLSRAQVESELLRLSRRGTSVRDDLADLIINGKVKPELQHYEALILENSDSLCGSAGNVRNLLEECAEQDIPLRQTVLAAAFRTLAVHPDPLLLADVLHACETQWISLDKNSLYFVAVSYLRAGQIELAQECMVHIYNEHGQINVWLYILLIRQLVDQGDWEAILRICYELQDDHMRQVSIPSNFWHWLLLAASEAEDVAITEWIWNLWVERVWIAPEETTILKVLQLAAKNGLPKLAQSAANILKHRVPDARYGIQFFTEASGLVQKAFAVADLPMPPTETLKRKGGTMWWLFKDDGRHLGRLRIDPFTAIHSTSETDNMWPNIRSHLEREKTENANLRDYLVNVEALERGVLYVTDIDPEESLHADDQELGWIDTQLPVPEDFGPW